MTLIIWRPNNNRAILKHETRQSIKESRVCGTVSENCLNKLRIKRREVFKGGINCILIIDLFVFFPPRRTTVVAEKFNQYRFVAFTINFRNWKSFHHRSVSRDQPIKINMHDQLHRGKGLAEKIHFLAHKRADSYRRAVHRELEVFQTGRLPEHGRDTRASLPYNKRLRFRGNVQALCRYRWSFGRCPGTTDKPYPLIYSILVEYGRGGVTV